MATISRHQSCQHALLIVIELRSAMENFVSMMIENESGYFEVSSSCLLQYLMWGSCSFQISGTEKTFHMSRVVGIQVESEQTKDDFEQISLGLYGMKGSWHKSWHLLNEGTITMTFVVRVGGLSRLWQYLPKVLA